MKQLALILFVFLNLVDAGDLSIDLDDGNSLILHEDRTWTMHGGGAGVRSSMTLEMSDGRSVILHSDKSWEYVRNDSGEVLRKRPPIARLSGSGFARKSSSHESVDAARQEAVRRVAKSLRKMLGEADSPPDSLLIPCIDILADESRVARSIASDGSAEVRIQFGASDAQDLLDCIEW